MLRLLLMSATIIVLFNLNACVTQQDSDQMIHTADRHQAAKFNIELGLAYLQVGNLKRAHYKLNKARMQDDQNPEVYMALASYFERVQEITEAGNNYHKAYQLAASNPVVLNNYGVFLCQHHPQQSQVAIGYLLQAARNPDYLERAASFANAGECAAKINQQKQAQQYLQHAVKLAPYQEAYLWQLIVVMQQQKRQAQQTMQLLKRYTKLFPNGSHYKQAQTQYDQLHKRLALSP